MKSSPFDLDSYFHDFASSTDITKLVFNQVFFSLFLSDIAQLVMNNDKGLDEKFITAT